VFVAGVMLANHFILNKLFLILVRKWNLWTRTMSADAESTHWPQWPVCFTV